MVHEGEKVAPCDLPDRNQRRLVAAQGVSRTDGSSCAAERQDRGNHGYMDANKRHDFVEHSTLEERDRRPDVPERSPSTSY